YYIGYDDSKIKKIAEKADTGTEEDYIAGMKEIARTITDDAASDFLFLFPNLVLAKSDIAGIPANRVSDAFRIADLSWNCPHGSMLTYAISRATPFALSLIVASVVVFALMSLLPGNAAQVALGTNATPEAVAALEAQYGLDRPPAIRYFDWMIGMAGGDFGTSYVTGAEITPVIVDSVQVTAILVISAIVLSILIAVPLGTFAAVEHRTWIGVTISAASQIGIAIPNFLAAIILVIIFSLTLGWFPSQG